MDLTKINNPAWAFKSLVNIQVNTNDGNFPLKPGTLFVYDPNNADYVHTLSEDDLPENFTKVVDTNDPLGRSFEAQQRKLAGLVGSQARIGSVTRYQGDTDQIAWLNKNFKLVPCPEELQIEKEPYRFPRIPTEQEWNQAFNKFKPETWPKEGGDVSKKLFKFGEKALFVEDWPLRQEGIALYADRQLFFKRGKEYPTLGSTEITVMVVNGRGELAFVPFFAVQNTHRIARWFAFKWWVKITLNRMGLQKSHGRFAGGSVPYEDNKRKKPAQLAQPFYIGERLRLTDDFPMTGWGALYHKGDVYPTLGIYRGTKQKPTWKDLDKSEVPMSLAFTEPRALIINSLGEFDLIPLSQIESTHTYDIFFMLKYYVIIGWQKLMNSFK